MVLENPDPKSGSLSSWPMDNRIDIRKAETVVSVSKESFVQYKTIDFT